VDADPRLYTPRGANAYFIIMQAVEAQPGLIHGKLHGVGAHCAMGSYWKAHPDWAIPDCVIDEVAGINDSAPTVTVKRRKEIVLQWLKWKLRCYGFKYRVKKPRST